MWWGYLPDQTGMSMAGLHSLQQHTTNTITTSTTKMTMTLVVVGTISSFFLLCTNVLKLELSFSDLKKVSQQEK